MPKRCPKCNRSSADTPFYGEFCKFCVEGKLIEELPEKLEVTVCKNCGMIRVQGKFVKPFTVNMESAFAQQLKGYGVRLIGGDEKSAVLQVTEQHPNFAVTVDKKFEVNQKKTLCEKCSRLMGGYYEAVVQLRGPDSERMMKFVERLTKFVERHNQFIAKVKEADNGYDVYVSDKKLTAAYLSNLEIPHVTSYTLYGLKNGRKVYRHTYAIRL